MKEMTPKTKLFYDRFCSEGNELVFTATPCGRGLRSPYQPQLFCPSTNTYYQVIGTRQRWEQLWKEILDFILDNPDVLVKVVNPDGSDYADVSAARADGVLHKIRKLRPVREKKPARPKLPEKLRIQHLAGKRSWGVRGTYEGINFRVSAETKRRVYDAAKENGASVTWIVNRCIEIGLAELEPRA